MTDNELVAAWIRLEKRSKSHNNDPDFEAWEMLNELVHDQPKRAYGLIEQIISWTNNKKVLGGVAAGPLEDLLVYHGEQFVGKVLDNARKDASWRFTLGCVWISRAKDATVKARVNDAIKLYFPNGTP